MFRVFACQLENVQSQTVPRVNETQHPARRGGALQRGELNG